MAAITVTAANVRPMDEDYRPVTKVAGEALTAGQAVKIDGTTHRALKAAAGSAGNANVLGVVLMSVAAGKPVAIASGSAILTGFTGLVPGSTVYLSNTAGGLDTAAGTVTRALAIALTTTTVMLNCPVVA